jgi:hypothetical protein
VRRVRRITSPSWCRKIADKWHRAKLPENPANIALSGQNGLLINGSVPAHREEMTVDSWDVLPHVPLQDVGPVSAAFIARGITDFQAAGRALQGLPYGRTVDRADFRAVLREGKGTCSTKHALLAALAHEQGLPVVLTLGIYAMHERNTPGVGAILTRYGLASLPEAHCYLTYAGRRIDITRSGAEPSESITQLLYEETIVPKQIGDYKVTLHRQYIQTWVNNNVEEVRRQSMEEIWRIREECIAALGQ